MRVGVVVGVGVGVVVGVGAVVGVGVVLGWGCGREGRTSSETPQPQHAHGSRTQGTESTTPFPPWEDSHTAHVSRTSPSKGV